MQEERAALSPPASGAERPDGSDSAPSDSARWGLVAISSDGRKTWRKCVSGHLERKTHFWSTFLENFTFIRSNIKPLKMPWYLLSNVWGWVTEGNFHAHTHRHTHMHDTSNSKSGHCEFQHVQAVKNHKTVTHTHATHMCAYTHAQAHTEFSLLRRLQLLLNWTPATYLMSHGSGNTAKRERHRDRGSERQTEEGEREKEEHKCGGIRDKHLLPWFHENEGCCRRVSSVLQGVAPKPSGWWRAGDTIK